MEDDPNRPATIADIESLKKDLNERIDTFELAIGFILGALLKDVDELNGILNRAQRYAAETRQDDEVRCLIERVRRGLITARINRPVEVLRPRTGGHL